MSQKKNCFNTGVLKSQEKCDEKTGDYNFIFVTYVF